MTVLSWAIYDCIKLSDLWLYLVELFMTELSRAIYDCIK